MSLIANITPAGMALSGNPVLFSITTSSAATFVVKREVLEVYRGVVAAGSSDLSLTDILISQHTPIEVGNLTDRILLPIENSVNITVDITNEEGNSKTVSIQLHPGGISKKYLRKLADANSNIFTHKLLNSAGNFLKTTRSSEFIITMRETELLPIQFIYPDSPLFITAGGVTTPLLGTTGSEYALNLHALRLQLWEAHNIFCTQFDIHTATISSCTILITTGTLSRELYILEFVNSWGAYERLEVTGEASVTKSKKSNTFSQYDRIVDDYVSTTDRLLQSEKFEVSSGYKSYDELSFILDMLSSDNITMIDQDGRKIKVLVSAEKFTTKLNPDKPQSIKLIIEPAEDEKYQTSSFVLGDTRIHTEQFNEVFN
ncbi:MAG: hypothetical protein ACRC3Z_11230 [Phocaeicola sp.]